MKWYDASDERCYYGGQKSIDYYNRKLQERQEQYPWDLADKCPDVAAELEEKGYCVLRQVFNRDMLYRLREEAEQALRDERLLKKNVTTQ